MSRIFRRQTAVYIRKQVEIFFKLVERDYPATKGIYKLALDNNGLCLMQDRDGAIKFYACATGGVGSEGATERSLNWIGFGTFPDRLLETLTPDNRHWCQVAMWLAETIGTQA
ncbi:MAG: hypothetical protein Q7K33_02740 [Candidatus Berkelbacteria bacterium]|nr:hypothetical protein [Candidatus Berkelbacteria bacterium]